MSVLDSLIKFRALEDAREERDVAGISNAVNNFIDIKRQGIIDELNRRNIESQIEARGKEDVFDKLGQINEGIAFAESTLNEPLKRELAKAGDDLLAGRQSKPTQSVRDFLEPSIAQQTPDTTVDEFIQPAEATESGVSISSDDQPFDVDEGLLDERSFLTGKPTERAGIEKKKAEANIAVTKQTEAQRRKDKRTADQDLINIRFKAANIFDQFVQVVEENQDRLGTDPGVVSGLASELFTGPLRLNEFVQAFKGGQIEFAAAAGRIAISGARAVRLISIFKKTAPTLFDTTESAAEQVAFSFRNAIASQISRNFQQIFPNIDFTTQEGQQFFLEKSRELDQMLRDYEREFKNSMLKDVYMHQPDLLKDETQQFVEAELLTDEEIDQMLGGGS